MITLPRLGVDPLAFPDVESALREPDGLLAFGGDLSRERLLAAYARGIFPWFSPGQPILWWSPDPRLVFHTAAMHVPRRLRRWLRGCTWSIRVDTAFGEVIDACAAPRDADGGTWITPAMRDAYVSLHESGDAHSVEVRDGDELVGGIYGVSIGRMFFGESMFSRRDHASKVALLALAHGLAAMGMPLLDAQVSSPHLFTLGGTEMPRRTFSSEVKRLATLPAPAAGWRSGFAGLVPATLAGPGVAPET
ncbi:leucyl/phenylalanyl-tRNA--protein transferase [Dokdonella sp. MW10]|uniref:leucyl/phenylalanyl-tRNA--protein transferase n=1 Tax=Dokdonella sp. MW10 TaxID=2992926 RepID=UPI003F7F1D3F